MLARNKIIGTLLWLFSAFAFAWTLRLALAADPSSHRDRELQALSESLKVMAPAMPSEQKAMLEQASKNLDSLTEGASLMEWQPLQLSAFFSLLLLGLASLNLLLRPEIRRVEAKALPKQPPQPVRTETPALDAALDELATMRQLLDRLPPDTIARGSETHQRLERHGEEIISVETKLAVTRSIIIQLAEQNTQIFDALSILSSQADEHANIAASTGLEWNTLGIKLRQLKESQSKLLSLAEKLTKQQSASHEQLVKAMGFQESFATLSERSRSGVQTLHEMSKGNGEAYEKLVRSISESNEDVSLANRLIKGLSERAEEIVNIIDVIDDIAEQTNQLALNASIEAARAGEQGKGFAVVAAEVRNLAARSSSATRSITDLLGTIQAEAEQASISLEKTSLSVASAQARISEAERSSRDSMIITRQVSTELSDLLQMAGEHSEDLKALERCHQDSSKATSRLSSMLSEVDQLYTSSYAESAHLSHATDRLARLMSRQTFKIQHSQRVADAQSAGFKELRDHAQGLVERSETLRGSWERHYQTLLAPHMQTRVSTLPSPLDLKARLEYCRSSLSLLTTGPVEVETAMDSRIADESDDIRIDTDLKKAG